MMLEAARVPERWLDPDRRRDERAFGSHPSGPPRIRSDGGARHRQSFQRDRDEVGRRTMLAKPPNRRIGPRIGAGPRSARMGPNEV